MHLLIVYVHCQSYNYYVCFYAFLPNSCSVRSLYAHCTFVLYRLKNLNNWPLIRVGTVDACVWYFAKVLGKCTFVYCLNWTLTGEFSLKNLIVHALTS